MSKCSKCGIDAGDAKCCTLCGTATINEQQVAILADLDKRMDRGGAFIAAGIALLIASFFAATILFITIGIILILAGFRIHNKAYRAAEKIKSNTAKTD